MPRAQSAIVVRPSSIATLLGRNTGWEAAFDGIALRMNNGTSLSPRQIRQVEVKGRLGWSDIVVEDHQGRVLTLGGLAHGDARRFAGELGRAVAEAARQQALLHELRTHGPEIFAWWSRVGEWLASPRWTTRHQINALEATRPRTPSGPALRECWYLPSLAPDVAALPVGWRDAVEGWASVDLNAQAANHNSGVLWNEKQLMREWFATVEKSPLTEEQIDAVIRFDNRTRVIAAAGSGKTSLMVAKAAYAIARGIAQPSEILMLAFNEKAASEMAARVAARVPGPAPRATTFHAFGLSVIGEALGRKPRAADLEDGGIGRLSRTVDELRDGDPGFRRDWDLFRLLFADPGSHLNDEEDDTRDRRATFPTLKGDTVRSRGEAMIANWLWINGVSYEYERPYEHDVADAKHSQYRPDFFYPEIGVYHEHWALDDDGNPNPEFTGYGESMAWRREMHRLHGTTLLETTWAHVMDGSDFDRLAEQLTGMGIELDENPYRECPGPPPVGDRQLLGLVREFLVHAKSNRIEPGKITGTTPRERLFLRLATRILVAWNDGLRREGFVDFEDMLNQATDLIRAGRLRTPYRLVMVDEMQDTSVARAELVRALIAQHPDGYLFSVGDDWQSINRFAGADLSVMSRFADWFGPADTCYLTRTFRSPQALCDVAGSFVTRNPSQLPKKVVSSQPGPTRPVTVAVVEGPGFTEAVLEHLEALDAAADAPTTVLLLGRYNDDQRFVESSRSRRWKQLRISPIKTVHSSKGTEADHVVILNVCRGAFPSTIRDDPLLALAMPSPETFSNAEERRLFYVALTRARRSVLLITRARRESPFIAELAHAPQVTVRNVGMRQSSRRCPKCGLGLAMSRRNGKTGHPFWGCSRYPACSWRELVTSAQRTS